MKRIFCVLFLICGALQATTRGAEPVPLIDKPLLPNDQIVLTGSHSTYLYAITGSDGFVWRMTLTQVFNSAQNLNVTVSGISANAASIVTLSGTTVSASNINVLGGGTGFGFINNGALNASGTLFGTANQISISGTNALQLSLPQDIGTNSAVQFGSLTLSGGPLTVTGPGRVTSTLIVGGSITLSNGLFTVTGGGRFTGTLSVAGTTTLGNVFAAGTVTAATLAATGLTVDSVLWADPSKNIYSPALIQRSYDDQLLIDELVFSGSGGVLTKMSRDGFTIYQYGDYEEPVVLTYFEGGGLGIDAKRAATLETTLTDGRVLISSGTMRILSSDVTTTKLGFLDATSSVQTQLDGKQATILAGAGISIAGAVVTNTGVLTLTTTGGFLHVSGTTGNITLSHDPTAALTLGGLVSSTVSATTMTVSGLTTLSNLVVNGNTTLSSAVTLSSTLVVAGGSTMSSLTINGGKLTLTGLGELNARNGLNTKFEWGTPGTLMGKIDAAVSAAYFQQLNGSGAAWGVGATANVGVLSPANGILRLSDATASGHGRWESVSVLPVATTTDTVLSTTVGAVSMSGAHTDTLPNATQIPVGREIHIFNRGAVTATITTTAGQTIGGAGSLGIPANTGRIIIGDGANFIPLGN